MFPNNNIFKLHFITSQSPSFISKYILNLSQLLINTNRMTLHFSIIYSTVHLRVRGHCSALEHFYELEGDDETYWNVCAVKDEV